MNMGINKSFSYILFAFSVFFSATDVLAETSFERVANEFSKKYDNGDSIAIKCKGNENQICIMKAKVGKIQRNFVIDFGAKGYVPTLDFIRMIGSSSKPWAFGAAISVDCNKRDEFVLPEEVPTAVCYVYLTFNGAGDVMWQEFMVVGQLMPKSL